MKPIPLLAYALMILAATRCGAAEPEDEGQWITFLSRRSGENLLYKMRPDGSAVTPIFGGELKGMPGIPEGATLYREPHFAFQSPDRKYFLDWAWDKYLPPNHSASVDFLLHLGRLDGGPTRVVAVDASEDFAWSPDSKEFLYGRYRQYRSMSGKMAYTPKQFVIASIDGMNEEIVLEKKTPLWGFADWSWDGKKLLFFVSSTLDMSQANCSLVEFDLESARSMRKEMPVFLSEEDLKAIDSNLKTLKTTEKGVRFGGGAYSPDGKTIATFTFSPDRKKDAELIVLDVATGTLRGIVKYPEGLRGPVRWSPDGEEILFCRHLPEYDAVEGEGGLGIWAIHPDGSGARFITTGWCADWR